MSYYELNEESYPAFRKAVEDIQADTAPKWGELTPAGVMSHLEYTMRITLGDIQMESLSNPLIRWVVRPLFFHIFVDWPKGKIKAPSEFFPNDGADFEARKASFLSTLDEYMSRTAAEPDKKVDHPLFGLVTLEYTRWTNGLHMRHHLKQFGTFAV